MVATATERWACAEELIEEHIPLGSTSATCFCRVGPELNGNLYMTADPLRDLPGGCVTGGSYVVGMLDLMVDAEFGVASSPDLISEIRNGEREVSRIRARQVRLLCELMRRSPLSKPDPSPAEIASQLDVSTDTAGALLETARRSPELSERMKRLETGEWSFDRATAMARLFAAGADDETLAAADSRDIGGIHKLGAMTRRIRRRDERQAHEERYVRCWPSLDESVGFIHGQLGGYDWQVVSQALDHRVDQFPPQARSWSREQRRADALVAIAQDFLDGVAPTGRTGGPIVTVLVEACPCRTSRRGCSPARRHRSRTPTEPRIDPRARPPRGASQ